MAGTNMARDQMTHKVMELGHMMRPEAEAWLDKLQRGMEEAQTMEAKKKAAAESLAALMVRPMIKSVLDDCLGTKKTLKSICKDVATRPPSSTG
jgi:hypothetical protein